MTLFQIDDTHYEHSFLKNSQRILKYLQQRTNMQIIIDLRDPPSETDHPSLATDSDSEAPPSYSKQTLRNFSGRNEDTNKSNISPSSSHHAWYPPPSQTPIYDFEMLSAGKEPGSEERILREGPPRRSFGRQKRLLQNFMSAAEELRQDIDRAWAMMLDEELCGAI
jgi:hypothetical protein